MGRNEEKITNALKQNHIQQGKAPDVAEYLADRDLNGEVTRDGRIKGIQIKLLRDILQNELLV